MNNTYKDQFTPWDPYLAYDGLDGYIDPAILYAGYVANQAIEKMMSSEDD